MGEIFPGSMVISAGHQGRERRMDRRRATRPDDHQPADWPRGCSLEICGRSPEGDCGLEWPQRCPPPARGQALSGRFLRNSRFLRQQVGVGNRHYMVKISNLRDIEMAVTIPSFLQGMGSLRLRTAKAPHLVILASIWKSKPRRTRRARSREEERRSSGFPLFLRVLRALRGFMLLVAGGGGAALRWQRFVRNKPNFTERTGRGRGGLCKTNPIPRGLGGTGPRERGANVRNKANFEQPDRGQEARLRETKPNLGRMGHLGDDAPGRPIVRNKANSGGSGHSREPIVRNKANLPPAGHPTVPLLQHSNPSGWVWNPPLCCGPPAAVGARQNGCVWGVVLAP